MKIGLLSYNVPHRKTYDVISLLNAKGYKDVIVYAVPLKYKKTFYPLYEHRPELNEYVIDTKIICENVGYKYCEGMIEELEIPNDMILLVCGACILPDDFVKNHMIINSHPGYIPYCRGLDSYKWAIYEGLPIGVTTHIIGDYVDAGEIIERKEIAIRYNDTFHSVAQRVYENEVGMLVNALEHLDEKHEYIEPIDGYDVHKRMQHEYEIRLMDRFNDIIKKVEI